MSAAPQRTVGIDVGGTKCLGVILDHDGKIVAEHRRPTPRGPGSLPKLIDTLAELVDVLGPYDEVGVGVPGLVTRTGRAAFGTESRRGCRVRRRRSVRASVWATVCTSTTTARALPSPSGCSGLASVRPTWCWSRSVPESVAGWCLVVGCSAAATGSPANTATWSSIPPVHRAPAAGEVAGSATPRVRGWRDSLARRRSDVASIACSRSRVATPRRFAVRWCNRRPERVMPTRSAVIDEFTRWVAIGLVNLTNARRSRSVRAGWRFGSGIRPVSRSDHEVVRRADLPAAVAADAADRVRQVERTRRSGRRRLVALGALINRTTGRHDRPSPTGHLDRRVAFEPAHRFVRRSSWRSPRRSRARLPHAPPMPVVDEYLLGSSAL